MRAKSLAIRRLEGALAKGNGIVKLLLPKGFKSTTAEAELVTQRWVPGGRTRCDIID